MGGTAGTHTVTHAKTLAGDAQTLPGVRPARCWGQTIGAQTSHSPSPGSSWQLSRLLSSPGSLPSTLCHGGHKSQERLGAHRHRSTFPHAARGRAGGCGAHAPCKAPPQPGCPDPPRLHPGSHGGGTCLGCAERAVCVRDATLTRRRRLQPRPYIGGAWAVPLAGRGWRAAGPLTSCPGTVPTLDPGRPCAQPQAFYGPPRAAQPADPLAKC